MFQSTLQNWHQKEGLRFVDLKHNQKKEGAILSILELMNENGYLPNKIITLDSDTFLIPRDKNENIDIAIKNASRYMDQTNLTANYNLGIHFYNRAVNIIKDLDVETSLEELAEKEDVCVDLFLKALPYVKTAYDIDPLRRETLIGLTGIYWSLNDLEKYDFYKLKLKELE